MTIVKTVIKKVDWLSYWKSYLLLQVVLIVALVTILIGSSYPFGASIGEICLFFAILDCVLFAGLPIVWMFLGPKRIIILNEFELKPIKQSADRKRKARSASQKEEMI